jgi:hypothetical protein
VHRAITRDGQAVAVKVQYPGIAETISADLGNVALIRRLLKAAAPGQDVSGLIEELRERIKEELDYEREAASQAMFAGFYEGHPTIHVPSVVGELSTKRVITSELATGARFAELLTWSQEEKNLAAETIYRYVFRSLYEAHSFNGDPHPGNYLFSPGGKVTFLDYGLVKHFTQEDLAPLETMVRKLCVDEDPEGFRAGMVAAGFLQADAPVSTDAVVDHMSVFYDTVRRRGQFTMTSEYATKVSRKFFDFGSPIARYANIPRSYAIVQRINLGLFSVLGELNATGDWRAIAEEIWPFFQGPPSTAMGAAEAEWKRSKALSLPNAPCPLLSGQRILRVPAAGRLDGKSLGRGLRARGVAGLLAGGERARAFGAFPLLDGRRERVQVGTQVRTADVAERAQVGDLGFEVVPGGPVARGSFGGGRRRDPARRLAAALVRLLEDHAGPDLRLAQDLVAAQLRVLREFPAVLLRVGDVLVGRLLRLRQHVDGLDVRVLGLDPGAGVPRADQPLAQAPQFLFQAGALVEHRRDLARDPFAEAADVALVEASPAKPGGREGGFPDTLQERRSHRVHSAAHFSLHP